MMNIAFNLSTNTGNPCQIQLDNDIQVYTRQRELQAKLEQTTTQNKKLVNFTYVISHNIRAHIANILGIIQLNDTGNEEDKELSWNIIKKSITCLDTTIHNLNDIIQIQTSTNLPTSKLNLMAQFRQIIESLEVSVRHNNPEINYHFDDMAVLETNPAYLESIIHNLFTNAIKYRSAERPCKLDISLHTEAGYQVLVFTDNGMGINLPKDGNNVFGLYKTFHGNADAKGMGLFIVKSQIEALGGKIEIESEVNQFTTFKVYFKK
jgi:signal transduction histidine kinase